MQYLDADSPENILSLATTLNALDRNGITVDNTVNFDPNDDSIFSATELFPDPYDENADLSWWQANWANALQWIAFGVAVLATVVVTVINPAAGAAMAMTCLKGALSGLVIGGVIGGVISAAQGSSFWDGMVQGAIYGAINGFTTAAILYGISSAAKAVKAANAAKPCKSACFIAGTLVLTEDGHKKIEDIEVGDKVWAYNEETGESAWKPVVQVFRNESELRTTLYIRAEDSTVDEVISTPGHKYYLPDNNINRRPGEKLEHASYIGLGKKWVSACGLKEGDRVLLAAADSLTGKPKYGIVTGVKTEQCESFTTYNFEVEDFHTYYVGKNSVCVHNAGCGIETGGAKEYSIHESRSAAFRAAKRHAGISMSEQPVKVMQSVDRIGQAIPGRTYIFQNGTQIMQHSAGHIFENGIRMSRHFNILGSRMHFFY